MLFSVRMTINNHFPSADLIVVLHIIVKCVSFSKCPISTLILEYYTLHLIFLPSKHDTRRRNCIKLELKIDIHLHKYSLKRYELIESSEAGDYFLFNSILIKSTKV